MKSTVTIHSIVLTVLIVLGIPAIVFFVGRASASLQEIYLHGRYGKYCYPVEYAPSTINTDKAYKFDTIEECIDSLEYVRKR